MKTESCGDNMKPNNIFNIFQKNKNALFTENPSDQKVSETYISEFKTQSAPYGYIDNKTARLMQLIGSAIDKWAAEYHMENLPKKIIFEQAFDAMRVFEYSMNNTDS